MARDVLAQQFARLRVDVRMTQKARTWTDVATFLSALVHHAETVFWCLDELPWHRDTPATPCDVFTVALPRVSDGTTAQWFILQTDQAFYLVNTEGYPYARYALQIPTPLVECWARRPTV